MAGLDLEVDHRAVAHVASPAWQAIGVVAIGFEVLAPGLAPEGRGDLAPRDLDRRDIAAGFLHLGDLLRCAATTLCHRHVGRPFAIVVSAHGPTSCFLCYDESSLVRCVYPSRARLRSRDTSDINASLLSSVREVSAPRDRTSSESFCLLAMSLSMCSSTVPRQMNL